MTVTGSRASSTCRCCKHTSVFIKRHKFSSIDEEFLEVLPATHSSRYM